MRILIVEDQPDISTLIADRVRRAGYIPDCVRVLADIPDALEAYDYPVMLLDRRLPDGDGLSAVAAAKRIRPGIRILAVTAARSIEERVDGLDAGVDDYLTKPFSPDELLARIRASLRRPGGDPAPPIAIGRLSFDLNSDSASIGGSPLVVPRRELLLLGALMRRAGRAVTFSTLLEEVYGSDDLSRIGALKMVAMRLRQRLNDQHAGVEIHAPRGIGYLIREARGP
ncbi:response regulator transcription factor [Methylosinus sp. H3A]|uniref:response regulator transcription factor n=1 Tax=Methylosinus sp. H3A TaxID=2785786 RepID=UPI0018C227B3|nr:response regulator transcription factor [Methylosinus sp. H3A]MBG0810856.1 response regulator transcription factor [Methylosinus sp. H3A]